MRLRDPDPDCRECCGDGYVFVPDPTRWGVGYITVCPCRLLIVDHKPMTS